MSLDIYAETLLENYEKPHNRGRLENSDASRHEENASCGDALTVYLKIKDDEIEDVKFDGDGCAISIGSASITSDYIKGKKLSEIEKMGKDELIRIIGVDPGPARLHCATLFLRAVKEAVFSYEKKPVDSGTKAL